MYDTNIGWAACKTLTNAGLGPIWRTLLPSGMARIAANRSLEQVSDSVGAIRGASNKSGRVSRNATTSTLSIKWVLRALFRKAILHIKRFFKANDSSTAVISPSLTSKRFPRKRHHSWTLRSVQDTDCHWKVARKFFAVRRAHATDATLLKR